MKKVISNLLLAVCIVVFLFSGWKLAGYYLEYKKADDEYDTVSYTHLTLPTTSRV